MRLAPDGSEVMAIPGYAGYFAGKDGRIWSSSGAGGALRQLSAWLNERGYLKVTVRQGGRQVNARVPRLVLLAWVGPAPSPSHEACHGSNGRADNSLGNLRWDTQEENYADRARHGTLREKLTDEQVIEMRRRLLAGAEVKAVAREFGIAPKTVRDIRDGKMWKRLLPTG
jgi:hypothetical protein